MPPPYTNFRFIAWEVPTATFKTSPGVDGLSGLDPRPESQAVERIPVVSKDLPDDDARMRLKRLAGVVDAAATRLANTIGGDNANTLKIFLVPEFYFRPPPVGESEFSNFYSDKIMVQILNALNTMFLQPDFRDWLFVCGTILWVNRAKEDSPLYFNTAVCVRGGKAANALRIVEKQWPSTLDGVPVGLAPAQDEKLKLLFEEWKTRKQRVFDDSGVQFGLEVCLDHAKGPSCRALKNVLHDWTEKSQGGEPPKIALHLLTAGGMPIQEQSVAARVGGYILRNDGMTNDGNRSELRKVQNYQWFENASDEDPLPSDLSAEATLENAVNATNSFDLPDTLKITIPPGYKTFNQSIVTYPALALPG